MTALNFRAILVPDDLHEELMLVRQRGEGLDDVIRRLLDGAAGPLREGWWVNSGVALPEGTELRLSYGGENYKGEVREGQLVLEGFSDDSPSRVAMKAIVARTGKKSPVNGWSYIGALVDSVRGREWAKLSDLRRDASIGR